MFVPSTPSPFPPSTGPITVVCTMATRRRNAGPPPDVDELVARARAALEREGALKTTGIGPASVRAAVIERLRVEGFEVAGAKVRIPIKKQILQALAHGAGVELKAIGAHVVGATKAEVTRCAERLVSRGEAHRVLRGKAVILFADGAAVLDGQELRSLERELGALKKALSDALKAKTPTRLLRTDVEETLARALSAIRSASAVVAAAPRGAEGGTGGVDSEEATRFGEVLRAVKATHDTQMGLSFVPRVIELLRPRLGDEGAKAALLEAAARGLLELRPEGGMNRLSVEELASCLPGPQGTRLSWARWQKGDPA